MCTLNKILELLKQKNLKQKDLTDFLGLSKQTSTEWKSGRNRSYIKYIPQISEFLGVSADYLLGTEQNDEKLNDIDFAFFGGLSDEDIKIMKKTKQLPATKKKALLNLLEAMEDGDK